MLQLDQINAIQSLKPQIILKKNRSDILDLLNAHVMPQQRSISHYNLSSNSPKITKKYNNPESQYVKRAEKFFEEWVFSDEYVKLLKSKELCNVISLKKFCDFTQEEIQLKLNELFGISVEKTENLSKFEKLVGEENEKLSKLLSDERVNL